jgi:hypothetical protein
MNYDAYGNPIKPKTSGVLVPVLLALLLSAAGNYWLWKERSKLSAEAFTATAKLAAAEAVQRETTDKLAKLEAERSELQEAKEQAVKDAQAKATELAKLKDDVAGVEVQKESGEDGDGKSKADDKAAKGEKGDKADKDKKADAKSKSKKAKKKSESSHKKESAKPSVDHEL